MTVFFTIFVTFSANILNCLHNYYYYICFVRLGQSIELSYSNIQRLVLKYLLPVCQRYR